jgi:hypothetical protein
MPSSATITAFYSFTANTKARASQVNANFDIFRGHLLPISPNTQTAINNTYDLGSSEYSWRRIYTNYIRFPELVSGTTTAGEGQIALSASINQSLNTTVSTNVSGSTITLETFGRPIEIGLIGAGVTTGTSEIYITGSTSVSSLITSIVIDGSTIATYKQEYQDDSGAIYGHIPVGSYRHLIFVSAGSHSIYLCGYSGNAGVGSSHGIRNAKMYGRELK